MTFTTPTFLLFFLLVYAAYWSLRRRGQNLLLLASSLLFYGWWDWRFLGLMLATAGVDYLLALGLDRTTDPRARKRLLVLSLVSNLGTLGFFKYFDFFIESFRASFAGLGVHLDPFALRIVLPVGISFYTFQALSYTIDVYRGELKAVRSPVQYFCFISFFPQLVAGPIERASNLLEQFERERTFRPDQVADGARQMLWGFFKKMVVADNMALIANAAYGDVGSASGWQLLWATYAFAIQIYCDFSGYTDIAIGCARMFDFQLMRNFAYPYFSRSIPEFWRRWHISLSTWFRDYLYLPLGGSRVGPVKRVRNVAAVFLVSGFWHGANWTFVVWGALHGLFYCVYTYLLRSDGRGETPTVAGSRLVPGARDVARLLVTFNLVCIAWVFFRVQTVTEGVAVLGKVAVALATQPFEGPAAETPFVLAAVLLLVEWVRRNHPHPLHLPGASRPVRWAAYYAVVAAILMYSQLSYTPFIYFQF